MNTTLDKQFTPELEEDLGKIAIRVVVFAKTQEPLPSHSDEQLMDLQADEDFSSGDSEVNSYLELPKRGKLCCVFLVNGQRHHGFDNSFIVNELKMKYLRKRMIIVVELDGLSQKAIAEIVQGSRAGFYEGVVYHKIQSRLIATLQNDPDLLDLEEEAEEQLAQLQAGDTAVQQALDQLIEHHFDLSDHSTEGSMESGGKDGQFYGSDGKSIDVDVVTFGDNGVIAEGPVLLSNHAAQTLRFPPDVKTNLKIIAAPKTEWEHLINFDAFVTPEIPGLTCNISRNKDYGDIDLVFTEQPGFDQEEYPLESELRIIGNFKNISEPRLIEKTIIIRPRKRHPIKPRLLFDAPTYLRITSRQPVRLIAGGADIHVKVIWDGKDQLTSGNKPIWTFIANCTSHTSFPIPTLSKPSNGRFEVLVRTPDDILIGTKLSFLVQAFGPNNQTLSVNFGAEVVEPPGPKKMKTEIPIRGQRRPPYKIVYVHEKDFSSATRWGDELWDTTHSGAFIEPKKDTPLTLCINQDYGLLKKYIDNLITKKADEQRTEEKKTKYVSHVAYHLYQMYLNKEEIKQQKEKYPEQQDIHEPQDEEMQLEINRVAGTLIRLMEVMR